MLVVGKLQHYLDTTQVNLRISTNYKLVSTKGCNT